MSKLFTTLGLAACAFGAYAAVPADRIDLSSYLTPVKCSEVKLVSNPFEGTEVTPLKSPKMNSSVVSKSVLLYEDFDNVPEGNTVTTGKIGERYVDFIASHYYEPGRYINNDYTPDSGTWEGDWIFAGKNGTVILQPYNSQMPARLNTPLGDYSGNLTVTARVRHAKAFYGADTESGYATTNGSTLTLAACIHGYDATGINDRGDTDAYMGQLTTGVLYEADGWQEVTFTILNKSANKDGYLCFSTGMAIEIDWIKVMDDNSYLAEPVINPATDFNKEGFTINWDPVRRSGNYYIDLWKTVYTAEKGVDEYTTFDDQSMPEWLSSATGTIVAEQGVDGSSAFLFAGNDEANAIETKDFGTKLSTFEAQVKFSPEDPYEYLTLYCDVYDEEQGWIPFGAIVCDNEYMVFSDYYYTFGATGEMFEGKYSAVKLYPFGGGENSKVYIDNARAFSPRPYVLERAQNEAFSRINSTSNDDAPYNYYTYTDLSLDPQNPGRTATHYTFVGLDPATEYWYRVRSHNVSEFTIGEKHHAFGVCAPEMQPATNTTKTSYTANWIDAPKAQNYTVTNYRGTVIEKADPQYSLMTETFSKCHGEPAIDAMESVGNTAEGYLDEYTDLKGWKGQNNSYGQNMIGGADFSRSYLITPPIMCNPNRGSLYIYVEAIGMPGDYIYIKGLKGSWEANSPYDEEGMLSGWIEIPAIEGEQIQFMSYMGYAFVLTGFEAMQAVEKGDIIRQFDSSVMVPAGVQSYTFSNLEEGIYAYAVTSEFTLEGENTSSVSDKFVTVDLSNGDSKVTTDVEFVESSVSEVARYSTSGVKVGKDYKGVVIVKNSDGSTSKQIVR